MSEDAVSLRLLLCFSYPRTLYPEPTLAGVPEIKRAATLARKFDCGPLLDAAESAITHLARSDPETAYALAWRFESREALRASARASVFRPWLIDDGREVPEFDELPAQSIILLGRYRSAVYAEIGKLAIDEICPHPGWINKDDVESARELRAIEQNEDCSCEKFCMGFRFNRGDEENWSGQLLAHNTPRWWLNFVSKILTDIKFRSIEASIIRATHAARKEARQCTRCCPLLDFDDALLATGFLLKDAIERQLEKVRSLLLQRVQSLI